MLLKPTPYGHADACKANMLIIHLFVISSVVHIWPKLASKDTKKYIQRPKPKIWCTLEYHYCKDPSEF